MSRKFTKSEYEALAAFRYALRQYLRFSEDEINALGLTPQQHQALLAIKGFPGRDRVMIGELAERLQIRHHSVVGLVDRLVAQGMVVREQAVDDRRQVFVALTREGSDLLERLSAIHRAELRKIGPQLIMQLEELVAGAGDTPVPAKSASDGRKAAPAKNTPAKSAPAKNVAMKGASAKDGVIKKSGAISKDGVAKDGLARRGGMFAKDGVAKDGVARDGIAKRGGASSRDGVAKGKPAAAVRSGRAKR